LERFRFSFTSIPSAPLNKLTQYQPSTTTTTTTTSTPWSPPQYAYPRYEIPDEYKTYQQQHDKEPSTDIGLSKEYSPNLRASYPGALLYDSPGKPNFDPYNYTDYNKSDLNTPDKSNAAPLQDSYSDFKLSPIAEDPYAIESIPSYDSPRAASPIANEPVPEITVSEPTSRATVAGADGTPISLQEDLENLLQNLEEHYKRRPSGIPKAPPPSPADCMSPNSMCLHFLILYSPPPKRRNKYKGV
jgi:hypothetical protein